MKTGILITARLGSTRLKRKHLIPINGQPIILYLIKRINLEFASEIRNGEIKVIIATSDELENRDFEQFAVDGVSVFYGIANNIPLRHLQTAQAHSVENIVSVDGDDILCSVQGIRAVKNSLTSGISYAKTVNLPFGMNSFGYSTDFLETALTRHREDTLETGWGRVFDPNIPTELEIPISIKNDMLRFTLDYDADLQFFRAVIEGFGINIYGISDTEIINYVLENDLVKITEPLMKEYWTNFYKSIEKEGEKSGF